MVGVHTDKAISNSTEYQHKNDSHCTGLDPSIRGRIVGMVKAATTKTTGKGKTKDQGKTEVKEKKEKSQQTRNQLYQTQLIGTSLDILHAKECLPPFTDINDIDLPPKLKLVSESNVETAWLKQNVLSSSSGDLSLFEEDGKVLLEKINENVYGNESKSPSLLSEQNSKNEQSEPVPSIHSGCLKKSAIETKVAPEYQLDSNQVLEVLAHNVSDLSDISGSSVRSSNPPAYQPIEADNNYNLDSVDRDAKTEFYCGAPAQSKSSFINEKFHGGKKREPIYSGKSFSGMDQASFRGKSFLLTGKTDKRIVSRNSKLRFPNNKGEYWSPLVKPLSEFIEDGSNVKKASFSPQDEEIIKQIDILLLCDFSYNCGNIFMVSLEMVIFVVMISAALLYIFNELPPEFELIHIMFFDLIMIFTLFALNSYASREIKVNGQYKVNSFFKIYWHLLRKKIDMSFKENYLFLDDWYGDEKYRYIKAKLKEVSIYGSAGAIDLNYSFYRGIDSC